MYEAAHSNIRLDTVGALKHPHTSGSTSTPTGSSSVLSLSDSDRDSSDDPSRTLLIENFMDAPLDARQLPLCRHVLLVG